MDIRSFIRHHDWYRQGATTVMLPISYPWGTCFDMHVFGKKVPIRYEMMAFHKNRFIEFYFTKRSLERVARFYLGKQRKDPEFIQKLSTFWHDERVKPYLHFLDSAEGVFFKKLSDQAFVDFFHAFEKLYLSMWEEVIFLDSFDYWSEHVLHSILLEEGKRVDSSDLDILLFPPKVSFLQKERLDLLDIAEKVLHSRDMTRYLSKNKSITALRSRFPWIVQRLDQHSKNYHWIHNDYVSVHKLFPAYFLKQLFILLGDKRKLQEERDMRRFTALLSGKKKAIVRRYNFSRNFVGTAGFLSVLGNLRDERKSYNQMGNLFVLKFSAEFSRRLGLHHEFVLSMFHQEFARIFSTDSRRGFKVFPDKVRIYRSIAKRRQEGAFMHTIYPQPQKEHHGVRAIDLWNTVRETFQEQLQVEGATAYPGKVRGTVKIIRGKDDFLKMRPGDILVAPNTRPEYVPIMKMAGAVVSDEGGITSHSAIVSRELRIPCIVGAQSATIVLKDGDQVEVDASSGRVKKIL